MRIKRPSRLPVARIITLVAVCLAVLAFVITNLPSKQPAQPRVRPRSAKLSARGLRVSQQQGDAQALAQPGDEGSAAAGGGEGGLEVADSSGSDDPAQEDEEEEDDVGEVEQEVPLDQPSPADDSSAAAQAQVEAEAAVAAAATAAATARVPAEELARRCAGTIGSWCGPFLQQPPIPAHPAPTGNRTCLWGCNFVGVCDAMAGWCRCPAGWTGDDCTTRMKRPCSQEQRKHGLEPYNEPPKLGGGGLTLRCAGLCDEDTATCYCPPQYKYGRIPADPQDPPGTPPQRHGRPLPHLCQPNKDEAGNPGHFGDKDPHDIYDEHKGWCSAELPTLRCACLQDGLGGETCDTHYEMFCPNQCNGRGECQHGFCKCSPGWFGQDCAYREAANASQPAGPGLQEERPWLRSNMHTPAAEVPAPGATRLRPLIYIYELPAIYNQVMLQYRMDAGTCAHRLFNTDNSTRHNDAWLYGLETGLHEMLLQSEHRTLDPEEADFFYLPVYTSCMINPVLSAADFPYFHSGPAAWRTHAAANMLIEVFHWVRSHHPYWDRNGGRDHILLMTHDEGSCWVPAVLRPAIILSYWGRTEVDHVSGTGFWPDNYTANTYHPVYQPEGHVGKLGRFPCYDAKKDLVLPVFSSPSRFHHSPFMGAPPAPRSILGFFRGRTQQGNPPYSRGTRQFLERTAESEKWWESHKIFISRGGSPPGLEKRPYSLLMASSVFCLALMGDGWSSRFTDAVLHGCIPVVIQDGIDMELSSLVDVEAFSLRVAQADMARLPEILKAVPQERVAEMQAAVGKVWHRYFWGSYRPYRQMAKDMRRTTRAPHEAKPGDPQPVKISDPPEDPAQDDAMATLLQWLYTRMLRPGRGDSGGGAAAAAAAAGAK